MNTWLTLGFLKGHRTKLVAVVLALLTLAQNLAWITPEQYAQIMGFLTSIGLLTAAAHQPK